MSIIRFLTYRLSGHRTFSSRLPSLSCDIFATPPPSGRAYPGGYSGILIFSSTDSFLGLLGGISPLSALLGALTTSSACSA